MGPGLIPSGPQKGSSAMVSLFGFIYLYGKGRAARVENHAKQALPGSKTLVRMTVRQTKIISWFLRLLAATIMLQTLFFKFSASPESVYIFSTVGMEPWGRIGSGIAELVASILLLVPATTSIGALIGLLVMSGALFFHITTLGLVVMNDHGQLFIYAVLVFMSCLFLLILNRKLYGRV